MVCGMKYGMGYGTHSVYHKHANYVAMPISVIPTTCTKDEVIAVIIHVYYMCILAQNSSL